MTETELKTKDGRLLSQREITIRQWRKSHPEKIAEYTRDFKQRNKDKIRAYNLEKVTCDCGVTVSRVNYAAHRRSMKHKKWEKDASAQI